MRNVSKLCLGLVTIFSLIACGKGKKCSKEDFAEKAKTIEKRKSNFKAIVSYDYLEELSKDKTKNIEKKGSGEFFYDAKERTWDVGDVYKTDKILISFNVDFLFNELDSTVLAGLKDSDDIRKINYFVEPFGYEEKVTVTSENVKEGFWYGIKDGVNSLCFIGVIQGTANIYCEWDEYGYLTKYVNEVDAKIASLENTEDYYKLKETYTISYELID